MDTSLQHYKMNENTFLELGQLKKTNLKKKYNKMWALLPNGASGRWQWAHEVGNVVGNVNGQRRDLGLDGFDRWFRHVPWLFFVRRQGGERNLYTCAREAKTTPAKWEEQMKRWDQHWLKQRLVKSFFCHFRPTSCSPPLTFCKHAHTIYLFPYKVALVSIFHKFRLTSNVKISTVRYGFKLIISFINLKMLLQFIALIQWS